VGGIQGGRAKGAGSRVRGQVRGGASPRPILGPGRSLLAFLLLLVAPTPGAAQTISGRVTDRETGEAIEAVRVQLISTRGDSLSVGFSDRFGSYRLRAPGPGEYRIRASRVGAGEVSSPPFLLREAGSEVVDLALAFTAIELDPILVRQRPFHWWERDKPLQHWEFWERREFYEPRGFGRFLAAGEAARFLDLHDLVSIHAPRLLRCTGGVALFVDGRALPGASLMVQNGRLQGEWSRLFRLNDVENVEIYPGGLKVPGELVSPGSGCGVVVVWLRSTDAS
jgi:hypothetical protein